MRQATDADLSATMGINVFLGYSVPVFARQVRFVSAMAEDLAARGFEPRTVGVTDLNGHAPLRVIRRVLLECNGLVMIAFRRTEIRTGASYEPYRPRSTATLFTDLWTTSPYCHVEAVMAHQFGLPVVLLRESSVIADGVLQSGVIATVQTFDLGRPISRFFRSAEWTTPARQWERDVHTVVDTKGDPPSWYSR